MATHRKFNTWTTRLTPATWSTLEGRSEPNLRKRVKAALGKQESEIDQAGNVLNRLLAHGERGLYNELREAITGVAE